ncbi:30S ribosomal protein S5 [Candidatus Pacearchaeota archaeon]|nr:30S ribosomal protein S5 [Candidatus Pacearchaeota archaeon]
MNEKTLGQKENSENKTEESKSAEIRQENNKTNGEVSSGKIIGWEPKTKLGMEVKSGKIKNIDEIINGKRKILEEGIVDSLINLKSDLSNIGQAKGKFGGGKRRVWRQTQRKTKEGNIPQFSTFAIIGDENGHVGVGVGKAKETLPAREKSIRQAKLNVIKIVRGCGSFDCSCKEPHSIPFKVNGKSGSIRLTLIPAAQGTGLVAASELRKVLKLAGIKDVYTRTSGKKRTTFNLVKACIDALSKTNRK